MNPKLQQKVILVTGGNRGIGYAIVQSLARHEQLRKGTTIMMSCRDIGQGQKALKDLQESGIESVRLLQLDVTSDQSVREAADTIKRDFGRLDVLINNAGIAKIPSAPDHSDLREAFQSTYNVNVTSVAMLMSTLLPLLRNSPNGKVIQVSSVRGSLTRLAAGELPPTLAIPYSISKTALNALTLQMSIEPENAAVEFQIACPGHCKTAFNGYRGKRDPNEGANVVTELVVGERKTTRFWETIGPSLDLVEVPW